MDGKATLEPSTQELLEELLGMSSRQTRLLEEIRDLLAAAQLPRRRSARPEVRESRNYD